MKCLCEQVRCQYIKNKARSMSVNAKYCGASVTIGLVRAGENDFIYMAHMYNEHIPETMPSTWKELLTAWRMTCPYQNKIKLLMKMKEI